MRKPWTKEASITSAKILEKLGSELAIFNALILVSDVQSVIKSLRTASFFQRFLTLSENFKSPPRLNHTINLEILKSFVKLIL